MGKKEFNFCIIGCIIALLGEVPEWTNGAVSKTAAVILAAEGSNPSLSAFTVKSHRQYIINKTMRNDRLHQICFLAMYILQIPV